MTSTRELVTYILTKDHKIRDWFETNHGFTLDKAQRANLEPYSSLVAVILHEGVRENVVSQAQVEGKEPLQRG